jgi:hypothetical protein
LITAFRAATLLSFSLVCTSIAIGQATPTATQAISLSAFAGVTGAYTGLDSSRNLGFTAGFDVSFKPLYRLYPSAEIRGTYPIDSGGVAGERNFLVGPKIERPYGPLHPYGDILYGRNKIEYLNGGYPNANGTLLYIESIASVLSFGGGADIDLTPHFAAKFDFQFQRYGAPVAASGDIYAKAFTAGVVYRIDFNHHFHYDKKTGQVTNLPKERTPPPPKTPAPPQPDNAAPAPPDAAAPPTPDGSAAPAPAPPDTSASPAPPDTSAPPAPAPAPPPQ